MRLVARRRLVLEISSYLGKQTSPRFETHMIRLDELKENPLSADRLVEVSLRYLRFNSVHAQLPNSSPIYAQFADSGSARRDESNEMCFVAGRRLVPEISSFNFCACVVAEFVPNLCAVHGFWFSSSRRIECVSSLCACAEAISGSKRHPGSRHISFDSSRRAEAESAICA